MPQSSFSFLSGSSVCSTHWGDQLHFNSKKRGIYLHGWTCFWKSKDWCHSNPLIFKSTAWLGVGHLLTINLEFNGPCSSSSLAQHILLPDLSSWSDTSYPKIPRLCREFWRHLESKDWKKKKKILCIIYPSQIDLKKKNERSDTWVIHSCLHFTVEETEAQRDRRLS